MSTYLNYSFCSFDDFKKSFIKDIQYTKNQILLRKIQLTFLNAILKVRSILTFTFPTFFLLSFFFIDLNFLSFFDHHFSSILFYFFVLCFSISIFVLCAFLSNYNKSRINYILSSSINIFDRNNRYLFDLISEIENDCLDFENRLSSRLDEQSNHFCPDDILSLNTLLQSELNSIETIYAKIHKNQIFK